MNWEEILQITEKIARDAGKLLMEHFGFQQETEGKTSSVDLVTQYDKLAEEFIAGELKKHFPDHRLMGEEGTASEGDSPFIWYVDPLDGTVNYAHGFPIFVVSIALYEGDQPRIGVVYDPNRRELFYAIDGYGAYMQHRSGYPMQIWVSGAAELGRSLLATGFPYDRHTSKLNNAAQAEAFLKTAQGVRRPGSAALDVCYVACGRLDGYWEYKLKIWDMAAAALILKEAGGRISHIENGQPMMPELILNLVASTPGIHQQMFDVLDRVEGDTS